MSDSKNLRVVFLSPKAMLVLTFAAIQLIIGCKRSASSETATVNDQIQSEEREFARSALLKVNRDFEMPSFDLAEMLKRGELQALPATTNFNSSESLYSSLNASQGYSVGSLQGQAGSLTRLETFVFREGITPGQFKFRDKALPIQISLNANAEIKVVRTFNDTAESLSVPPFSLVNLPLNETNAMQMRVGDLFVIPLESQFITAVDGSFIKSAARAGAPLFKLLGSSMSAHGGSGLRANLLVSGRFEMHIFKTSQRKIRVRFFEQSSQTLSGGGNASASAALKYSVLPLSKLHTIGELKKIKRVRFYGEPRLQLSDSLKGKFGTNALLERPPSVTPETESEYANDGLVDAANRVTLSAEKIQQLTTDRLNQIVGGINENVIKKVNEPIEQLKKYADQEFALSASASWEVKRSSKIQFFSEYEFDIGQTLGAQAYLHAVSGASILMSDSSKMPKLNGRNSGGHNLVIAERIASDTLDQKDPPVRRLLSASARSTLHNRNLSINFGNFSRFGISESWSREKYAATISEAEAPDQRSDLVRWTYSQGYKLGIVSDHQTRISGYLSSHSNQQNQNSMFWYTRLFDWRGWNGGQLNSFFNTAYNVLGPVAESLGLGSVYKGEVSGPMRGRMTLALTDKALRKVFDGEKTRPHHVWTAVARVAESFDNTFGLPFVMFPMGVPSGLADAVSKQSCETITRIWGSFYCHFIAREFLPALQAAQSETEGPARIRFFEAFMSRGFGANKVGSDLLARVLIELLIVSGDQLSPEDLAVQLEALQVTTSDSAYNPRVICGDSKTLELLGVFSPFL